MTTLNLDDNQSIYQIRAYEPGVMVQVNDERLTQSFIITPSKLYKNWAPLSAHSLTPDAFSLFLDLKPDVLLLGTGTQHVLLTPDIYAVLINAGIGVEIMNTGAACRTYNALSAENRHVAAGLIIGNTFSHAPSGA
ncbi:MAG TPA: Mth938-like domain-containing protein [Gammaproteobacteria bacterium]|jgi:uncharacterized protein|nr:Mth938-like domain-containing protein [Gammaproteobacteria bacterium]